ncbi:AI-2E family transporter [Pontibacillus salicampi]|uniref:AI-2E family transporter n=1 Tax=Pontibacillus salicampi TaxID=1449801 RepID=A0ABV6LJM5_9BACI
MANWKDSTVKWMYRAILAVLVLLIVYLLVKLFPFYKPFLHLLFTLLIPFLISMFIAYLLHPVVEALYKQNLPRWLAISLIYILFFGGIGYVLYKMYPVFIKQLRELINNLPGFVDTYRSWIYGMYERTSFLPESVHDRMDVMLLNIERMGEDLIASLGTRITGMLDIIILLAVIPVLVFYMLKDYPMMKRLLWQLTPRKFRNEGKQMLAEIDESLGGYIRGQLLVCLFVGVISILLLWLIGMHFPLVLGAIMGVTNIIPYFGPIFGAIPAVIIAFTINAKMMLFVIVVVFIVQLIESNLLSPYIVGKSLHIHPVLIIFALLVGGEVAGIAGMILAVPALTIVRVIIHHVRLHRTE